MIGSGLTNDEPSLRTAVHPSAALSIEVFQVVGAQVVHQNLHAPRNHLLSLHAGEPAPRLVTWHGVSHVPSARDPHHLKGRHEFPIDQVLCVAWRGSTVYMSCSHNAARCAPAASIA